MQKILLSCNNEIMTPEQVHRFLWTKVSEYAVTRKQLKAPHQVILKEIMDKYNLHLLNNNEQIPPIELSEPHTIAAKQYFYVKWLFEKNELQMACIDAIQSINDNKNIHRDCCKCPVTCISDKNVKISCPNVCHGENDYTAWRDSRNKKDFKKYALLIANAKWENKETL